VRHHCYLISDDSGKHAAVIDPADQAEEILLALQKNG
jgi:hypothetical protein